MGDKISCCDAKTQLDNTNTFSKLGEGYSNKKLENFSLPPMDNDIRNLITRVEKSKYYRSRPDYTLKNK